MGVRWVMGVLGREGEGHRKGGRGAGRGGRGAGREGRDREECESERKELMMELIMIGA